MADAGEEQPLLRPILEEVISNGKHDETILDFEDGDSRNPMEWTVVYKWFIVFVLALQAFTVTFTCIGVVPVASSIVEDLDGKHASSSTSALLVTIWELGEAAGPLLIAPLSELFGRYPVINVCNILFIAATLLAASSQSTKLFIAARMLTGLTVASNVLNPAIVGDMFESEKRGSAMSFLILAPLIGSAIGPTISGAIAQTLGWREVLFIAAGLAVVCEILFLMCFKETYKMAILRKQVAKLQPESREFGIPSKRKSKHENVLKLWQSITRPAAVLFGSSVLMLLSLYGAVVFSFFYVMSVSLPVILQEVYDFTPAQTGAAFISFSVGSFLSVMVCNFGLDRIYVKLRGSHGDNGKPEYRLPLSIIGGFAMPFSIAAYGWIAQLRLPVPLLLVSVGLMGFTLILAGVPMSAYVVDASGLYSASAMTGVIVTRCLMGTFLPLTSGPLAEHLGYGWGFMCLSALSLSIAVIPVLILRYGEVWRQRSVFTRDA
ncbi:MFS general substrate transporter [Dothidotthia symphoricarpi CBS 119687]|uniref:MFS general substrate transporter n=1 Tax=Dothidotthia symphoricarpi CBS 119687 TaxID=1392245 RepID=A0A6A6ADG4_9PLEO|nr:MFS general substrate transporter [Dothidotthia symphoricarpi CBS 119687]KAF2128781.1 MFS general substrate transporter [Dothidotthia symphoricarpi CBS 119687]